MGTVPARAAAPGVRHAGAPWCLISGLGTLSTVLCALGKVDVEVLVAAATAELSGLGAVPGNVQTVGFLPLPCFLPCCALIVYHGGSGTTTAVLHDGIPQLVLPSFADNYLSAQRVTDRGVGLSLDPATADASMVRTSLGRLLDEPIFAAAAREVRAEMATRPSPSAVIERLAAARTYVTRSGGRWTQSRRR